MIQRTKQTRLAAAVTLLLPFGLAKSATAQDAPASDDKPQDEPQQQTRTSLGLAPGTPQVSTLPGGITPAYGQKSTDEGDWRFDFHGFITMPLRLGLNKRSGPVTNEQYETVLHAPPVVPDYRDSFTYTGVVPEPYVQLNFSYGNSIVTGNVFVLSRTASTGASYFDSTKHTGITDAFLTFNIPDLVKQTHLEIHVGAFTNRYGSMGEYDEGRYGAPVIARTNGVGETVVAQLQLSRDWSLELQQGIQGQLDKAPNGIMSDAWNDYADPNVGTSFVHHLHGGLGFANTATLGLHYMSAWSQDDRASQGVTPDGKIGILGADLRFTLGRFGHLYLVGAYTDAENSRSVGRIVEILNAPGGPGLMKNYLGPNSNGTGTLTTLGFQYDLSVARYIYGNTFDGMGPDIVGSLFGLRTHVTSDDPAWNDVDKQKFGIEGTYSLLSWLAASARIDHVQPNVDDKDESFTILSPKVIFRTDWQSHDQVALGYSHFFYGNEVVVRSGTPPMDDPTINPDEDVISLSASMWW
jgi:hypothetical protein